MIHVIATIELREGKREAFLKEFQRLIPLVRVEPGCVEYTSAIDLRTNIDGQLPPRDHVVVVVEKWESLESLRLHLQAHHMREYRDRVKDLVLGTQLQVLEPIGPST
jgi:quinol monooxygenase YgiN